MNRPPRSHRR